MDISGIITAISGSAVLFGAVAWLVRSIVTHVLSKDIEKFKVNLQAESQKELVRLQSSLQLTEFEHQVRFSQLHERKVNILSEMYSRLVVLHRAASTFVRFYPSVKPEKQKEYLAQLWNAADAHGEYFDKHRIFFKNELCEKIDGLNGALSKASSLLATFVSETNVIKVSDGQVLEEWDKSMSILENEVPIIKQLLEQSFREELGVLQHTRENNA